jgi:hypothetical protein
MFNLDASERMCRLNPSVMNALTVLESAHDNVDAALALAVCCIDESMTTSEYRHWLQICDVLSGKQGGRA